MPKDTSNHSDSEIFRKSLKDVTPLKDSKKITQKKKENEIVIDSEVFRNAVADAIPLKSERNPKKQIKEPPKPIPKQRLMDEKAALKESQLTDFTPENLLDTDESLYYASNGISVSVVKKLRRGFWKIQGELDLHGFNTHEAREAYYQFIKNCSKNDKRCVRIIHGKGLRSAGKEPVLKNKVKSWLKQTGEVLAFCQAPGHMGGSGAVIVLIKGRQRHSHRF